MRKITAFIVLLSFIISCVMPPQGFAQAVSAMGLMVQPGASVTLTPSFTPAHLRGMVIDTKDPFKFDFIIRRGDDQMSDAQKQDEYQRLIKYFLAALATPDQDQWVNLSPFEKDRILPDNFGLTVMGRDLLAQDYLLKQLASSLTNPDTELGKKFWEQVYKAAYEKFGTTDIPTDTLSKVWIIPDKAVVYEQGNAMYVTESRLKVMTDSDYSAMKQTNLGEDAAKDLDIKAQISNQVMREVIIPAIEKEVNEGKSFAPVRQVYSGMLLATWYKMALKESILNKVYGDRSKVKGVDQDPKTNQAIYEQYLSAFKKGVVNMIREDVDQFSQEVIPRKYFSGGLRGFDKAEITRTSNKTALKALLATGAVALLVMVRALMSNTADNVYATIDENGNKVLITEASEVKDGRNYLATIDENGNKVLIKDVDALKSGKEYFATIDENGNKVLIPADSVLVGTNKVDHSQKIESLKKRGLVAKEALSRWVSGDKSGSARLWRLFSAWQDGFFAPDNMYGNLILAGGRFSESSPYLRLPSGISTVAAVAGDTREEFDWLVRNNFLPVGLMANPTHVVIYNPGEDSGAYYIADPWGTVRVGASDFKDIGKVYKALYGQEEKVIYTTQLMRTVFMESFVSVPGVDKRVLPPVNDRLVDPGTTEARVTQMAEVMRSALLNVKERGDKANVKMAGLILGHLVSDILGGRFEDRLLWGNWGSSDLKYLTALVERMVTDLEQVDQYRDQLKSFLKEDSRDVAKALWDVIELANAYKPSGWKSFSPGALRALLTNFTSGTGADRPEVWKVTVGWDYAQNPDAAETQQPDSKTTILKKTLGIWGRGIQKKFSALVFGPEKKTIEPSVGPYGKGPVWPGRVSEDDIQPLVLAGSLGNDTAALRRAMQDLVDEGKDKDRDFRQRLLEDSRQILQSKWAGSGLTVSENDLKSLGGYITTSEKERVLKAMQDLVNAGSGKEQEFKIYLQTETERILQMKWWSRAYFNAEFKFSSNAVIKSMIGSLLGSARFVPTSNKGAGAQIKKDSIFAGWGVDEKGNVVPLLKTMATLPERGELNLEGMLFAPQESGLKIRSTVKPADVGGIDFARSSLNMQIKRDGSGVPLPISQQNLDNIKIDGLVPVILNIQPAASLPIFSAS
ncbi:MAG: hypothetical protein WCO69_04995 [Candidatus Omnitrophota bacterium]